jgi:hypothetical protein
MQCQCQCHASVPNHGERAARAYYHRTTTTGNTLAPARPDWPNPAGSASKQSSNQAINAVLPIVRQHPPEFVHTNQRRRRRREDKRRKKIIGKGEKKPKTFPHARRQVPPFPLHRNSSVNSTPSPRRGWLARRRVRRPTQAGFGTRCAELLH